MEIYTKRVGGEVVLFAIPEEDDKICGAKEFTHVGEPLVAVLKKDPGYRYPHIEIRKEK